MTEANEPAPARREPSGVHLVGLLLAAVAALLLLLALTALNWLSSGGLTTSGKPDSSFTGIRSLLRVAATTHTVQPRFVAHQYFTWGAWVLLAIAVVAAALGNVLGAAGRNGRAAGLVAIVFGLVGVGATFAAVDLLSGVHGTQVPAYSDYIKHVGPAFFCAVAGFLVTAFAGAAAARRPAIPAPEDQPVDAAS